MTQEPERTTEPQKQEKSSNPGEEATNAGGENRTLVSKREAEQPPSQKGIIREWIETIVIALVIALGVRYFVVQVYLVEGQSMEPTLHTGERLFVNKMVYRLRDPKPGEVIVLQDPSMESRELIKRVIALAGERIAIENGITFVNGKPLKEPYITPLPKEWNFQEVTVQPGNVFVMGDNRPNSTDSRIIGQIPVAKIDGKAFFLFWPLDQFNKAHLDQNRQIDPNIPVVK